MALLINLDVCRPVLFQAEAYNNVPYFLLFELMPCTCAAFYCTQCFTPIIIFEPHMNLVT